MVDIQYDDLTVYEHIKGKCASYENETAYVFYGRKASFDDLLKEIDDAANGLSFIGIGPGDKVLVILPNCPQCILSFYALNKIGAISVMIHPLSAENELVHYADDCDADFAITTEEVYPGLEKILDRTHLKTVVVGSVSDYMGVSASSASRPMKGRIEAPRNGCDIVSWNEMISDGRSAPNVLSYKKNSRDVCAILYTGGTTGVTKGVMLSDHAFNAQTEQARVAVGYTVGDLIVVTMPMFHGFGLAVCTHSALSNGVSIFPLPRFDPEEYLKLIIEHKSTYIGATPSLFERLADTSIIESADLSFIRRIYSGADKMSPERKTRLDAMFAGCGTETGILNAYGLTEVLALSTVMQPGLDHPGSVGLPLPDCHIKIVEPGTENELPRGESGEICISGPCNMLGYLNQPEETEKTLRIHSDGMEWVHTGDLGSMDADGFLTFIQRINRMIVTNGYNVYPSQLEAILESHEYVSQSCVIGVPDKMKIHRVKILVVLKPGIPRTKDTENVLLDHLKANVARYAIPHEIEFMDEFPRTRVGKVDYRSLEKMHSPVDME